MAIPSGSGTEVLKRYVQDANSGGYDSLPAVGTNHIHTVLTIIIANTANAVCTLGIAIDTSGDNVDIINNNGGQTIPAYGTFVFSDKIVLHPADVLKIYTSQSSDLHVSYIDQDWT
tara:strand:+ start:539 stop:886 length:348 start_codon:yes stop_codon:yes gene_type:complete